MTDEQKIKWQEAQIIMLTARLDQALEALETIAFVDGLEDTAQQYAADRIKAIRGD